MSLYHYCYSRGQGHMPWSHHLFCSYYGMGACPSPSASTIIATAVGKGICHSPTTSYVPIMAAKRCSVAPRRCSHSNFIFGKPYKTIEILILFWSKSRFSDKTNEKSTYLIPECFRWLAGWLAGCLAAQGGWLLGCPAAWLPGCLAAWLLGCLAAWLRGYL